MKVATVVLLAAASVMAADSVSAATAHWEVDGDNVVSNTIANALFVDGEGDDWTGAVLLIDLVTGSAYQDAVETPGGGAPTPIFFPTFPSLEFDTYFGILGDGTGGIAGSAGDLGNFVYSQDGPTISSTWFNTATNDTGPVQIANITLSNDAVGTWQLITSFAGGQLQSSGTIPIPEPATLSLIGLGGLLALRRR